MNFNSNSIDTLAVKAKDAATDVAGAIENTAQELAKKTQRLGDRVGDKVDDLRDELGGSDDLLRSGRRGLKQGAEGAKTAYDRFGSATCDFIAEKPATAVAIAALAGFVAGGILLTRLQNR